MKQHAELQLNKKYMKDQYNPDETSVYLQYQHLETKEPLWMGNDPKIANICGKKLCGLCVGKKWQFYVWKNRKTGERKQNWLCYRTRCKVSKGAAQKA